MKLSKLTPIAFAILASGCASIGGGVNQTGEAVKKAPNIKFDVDVFASESDAIAMKGDEVVFVIKPKGDIDQLKSLSIDFDGLEKSEIPVKHLTLNCDVEKKQCDEIYTSYEYMQEAFYKPTLTYEFTDGESVLRHEINDGLAVKPTYQSDKHMLQDLYVSSLDPVIRRLEKIKRSRKDLKVALAILTDAHVEHRADYAERYSDLINNATMAFQQAGISVVESHPEALERMAPHALVDIKAKLAGKTRYLDHREFGLVEDKGNNPMIYGIKPEGIDDHLQTNSNGSEQSNVNATAQLNDRSIPESGAVSRSESRAGNNNETGNSMQIRQDSSLLIAQFSTADVVVFIDPIFFDVTHSKPTYMNPTFERKEGKRNAQVEFGVRVLDKSGINLWQNQIEKSQISKVIPAFFEDDLYLSKGEVISERPVSQRKTALKLPGFFSRFFN